MPTKLLSQTQIEHFHQQGFLPPVRILSGSEAKTLREQLEDFEARYALINYEVPLISIVHTEVDLIGDCLRALKSDWDRWIGVYAHSQVDLSSFNPLT